MTKSTSISTLSGEINSSKYILSKKTQNFFENILYII